MKKLLAFATAMAVVASTSLAGFAQAAAPTTPSKEVKKPVIEKIFKKHAKKGKATGGAAPVVKKEVKKPVKKGKATGGAAPITKKAAKVAKKSKK